MNAALDAGAPILWIDPDGRMMAVRLGEDTSERLYKAGAVFVTQSPAIAGCAAALRA